MPKIINMTPHTVAVYNQSETELLGNYPSAGVIRLETQKKFVKHELSSEVPVCRVKRTKADLSDVPEEKGTYYIVSALVQEAHPERLDFIAPNTSQDTAGAVRDDQGRIIGVKSFIIQ